MHIVKIFKSKGFHKLARKEKIDDEDLINAVKELESGLFDADLGRQVYKKRLARKGQGKRGGYRTIVLFKKGNRAFFLMGFQRMKRQTLLIRKRKVLRSLPKFF